MYADCHSLSFKFSLDVHYKLFVYYQSVLKIRSILSHRCKTLNEKQYYSEKYLHAEESQALHGEGVDAALLVLLDLSLNKIHDMVNILGGNSEHAAHVWTKTDFFSV